MSTKVEAALASLSRIRVAETIDADGHRRVWHQGDDVDLLSWVDAGGKLLRQELTLLGDHFQWTTKGLRTGYVADADGSAAAHSAELVSLDVNISENRLAAAKEALARYTGDDKYVQHIRLVIESFLRGLQERDEVVITAATGRPKLPPPPEASSPNAASRTKWIVAAAVAAIALAAILLLVR